MDTPRHHGAARFVHRGVAMQEQCQDLVKKLLYILFKRVLPTFSDSFFAERPHMGVTVRGVTYLWQVRPSGCDLVAQLVLLPELTQLLSRMNPVCYEMCSLHSKPSARFVTTGYGSEK